MEFIGEKIIKLQDAKYKTHQNNSNEASIFISGELAEKLNLVENKRFQFIIEKSDLIKLLCFTFGFKGPIYKKEVINLDLNWFESQLNLINTHFNNESEFWFEVKKQSQERYYFIGIEQTSGLNIRNLFIQDHVKLLFYKKDSIDLIKIECSPEIYKEPGQIDFVNNSPNSRLIFDLSDFNEKLLSAGLLYSDEIIQRFVAALLTKPFVILSGLSGSGKTKLAQAFVQWICELESQYRIIPVGADWTNREPLLGFPNALNPKEYVKPDSGVLDLIIKANNNPELPYFLILDEMNLSHVERYFADFLSVMESKEEIPLYAEGTVDNEVPSRLKVPSNLFIIGTVNIDETTNMFSPKVLDRANTIEFRVTKAEMESFLENIREINMDVLKGKGAVMAKSFLEISGFKDFSIEEEINKGLIQFFSELKKTGAEFGYRSATEILRLIHQLTLIDGSLSMAQKLDIAIMQKLLPKLHGSRRKLCPILETLGSFCIADKIKIVKDVFDVADYDFNNTDVIYPLSLEKITRMYRGAVDNGFASFAEA
jgi:5-methylcytosine-specific restriction protein B